MVNSKIVNNSKQVIFPCLMENDAVVVLFHNEKEGIVIHRLCSKAVAVGSQMTDNNFNMDNFQVFNGTIELYN